MKPYEGICGDCGFDWDQPVEALLNTLKSAPERFTNAIAGANELALRTRPQPKAWSALEYIAHTRDGVTWYEGRIRRTIEEDRPQLDGIDVERETEMREYHREETGVVLSELANSCGSLAQLLSSLSVKELAREALGSEGDLRTVLLLARRAAHETEHHCLDALRTLAGHVSA